MVAPSIVRPPVKKKVLRWDVINVLLGLTQKRRFLEIGVQNGSCGARVQSREKWGVDPAATLGARQRYTKLHQQTSDAFFEELPAEKLFDVVLVDGLHHADQVLRDVDNALAHLAPGGFIVMHDCNPQSEIVQRVPRASGVWNGDCWKAMVELRQRADLIAFTIDTDHGVGVVRKGPNANPLCNVPRVLDYSALERDRRRLLDLVPPGVWMERVDGEPSLGRVVVLSAVFGGRDAPAPAPAHDVDEYVMFTDGRAVPGWRTVKLPTPADPRAAARRIKTLALDQVDADVVVWIDGRIAPTGIPIRPLLREKLATADISTYPHPWRRCAYSEARECAKLGRASRDALEAQTAAYRAAGFPAQNGLWNTMVLARRRTDAIVQLGRAWWAEIERHTLRDQVSLPFVLWKLGIVPTALGPDIYRRGASKYFMRGSHARMPEP